MIDLEIVAVFVEKEAEGLGFKVSANEENANALMTYYYGDDDDCEIEYEGSKVPSADITIDKTAILNGHSDCPFLVQVSVRSFDEDNYTFDHWTVNGTAADSATISGMEISSGINGFGYRYVKIDVEHGSDLIDLEIVAVFSSIGEVPVMDTVSLGNLYLIRADDAMTTTTGSAAMVTSSDSVWVGQRTAIVLSRSYSDTNPNGVLTYHFYSGENTSSEPIATFVENGYYTTNNLCLSVLLDSLPYLEKITVTVQINGGDILSKTYDVTVWPSEKMKVQWLEAPSSDTAYPSESRTAISGPNVYGSAAFINEHTGELNLYFAVSGGVMQYTTSASSNLVWMDGMQFAYNWGEDNSGYALALGGANKDSMAAFVKETAGDFNSGLNICYCIYECLNGTWSKVSGSDLQNSYTNALVLAKNNIWVSDKHWDGTVWADNEITFNSFWKAESTTAFAGSADGIYRYENGVWMKLAGTTGTMYLSSGCISESGTTLIASSYFELPRTEQWYRMWNRNEDTISRVDVTGTTATVTALDVGSLISTSASTKNIYVGIASDGEIYAVTNGRAYYLSAWTDYKGSYLYKYENGAWVYQNVDEFNNETDKANLAAGKVLGTTETSTQRPDGIRHIENPIEGVTIFAGQGGGNYIVFGNCTISFETNGGSTVTSITQEIGSRITPPASPTRDGYTFAGWYTLENLMTNGASYTWSVMPAADITLYAKWIEDSDSDDPYATEREKALESLDTALDRLDRGDYDEDVWEDILSAYESGQEAIEEAETYDEIYAALNAAIAEINALAQQTSGTMTVAVTVEKLTVDGSYIIEPTLLTVDRNSLASIVVTDLLIDHYPDYSSKPYTMTGTETQSFYLSGVYDADIEDFLSEFDHGNESGWMYCVNGSFPGVGASSWILKNGDVMRWQYTCESLGADIGSDNRAWGSDESAPVADKDALIWRVAEINQEGKQADYGEAYTDAMTVLQTLLASQDEVDAALAALKKDDSGSGSGGSGSGSGNSENATEQTEFTAEEIQEAVESSEPLTAETDQGSITLSPETLKTLAETEKDVTIDLTENEDGSLTITVTAGDEDVTVPLAVALDVPADSLALAIVGKDGTETVIRKSWVENGVAHATIPAGATVKAVKNAKSFIDVKDGNWFKGAVDFVSAHALFKGVSEDEFAPQSTMTRAMLVTVLYRLENEPKTSGVSFEDVAAGTWYTDAVAWAAENRIVLGDGTGFNPNGNVTREQIATILYRYVQYLGMEATGRGDVSKFSDGADVSTWAQDAMAWAVKVGLFQGDDAGKLNPQGDATRAEVATLLERLVKFIVK